QSTVFGHHDRLGLRHHRAHLVDLDGFLLPAQSHGTGSTQRCSARASHRSKNRRPLRSLRVTGPEPCTGPCNATASFDCAVCAGRTFYAPNGPIKPPPTRSHASEGPRRSLTATASSPLLRASEGWRCGSP